jgi:uroporphyrinogen-III decarboxylase
MNPRERVFASLNLQVPDRTPSFEVWIDGLFAELGVSDPCRACAGLGQDAMLMPSQNPPGSNAWRELILPCHQRVARELPVPVIWHSDGRMEKLLPFAVEAGFAGVHGLEPLAGNLMDEIKARYGGQLALLGNVDINLFFQTDLELIRADVRRSYEQGGSGGFLLSSCNNIHPGMNPAAVREFFRCQAEYGAHSVG